LQLLDIQEEFKDHDDENKKVNEPEGGLKSIIFMYLSL